ncbi:MAG TPA: hypothetical protein VGR81_14440 [Candidatus Acidoferrales bacterium]|nr:hypothetical protein [Candidatus Acidoferrales bacterium]
MNADERIVETDEGAQQPLMHIRLSDGQESTFYFTFLARFEIGANRHTLQHATLLVLQDLFAGEITPLFRAEWDQAAASDPTSEHAQPHWHFVQRPEHIEAIVRTVIARPAEFVPEGQSDIFSGLVDCGRIHFSMASLWGKGQPFSHKQLFQGTDFSEWFANLTKYVAGQISYVVSKVPGAMVVRDFVPE